MASFNPVDTYKRYRSLSSHRISSLPILILMPHSACNCRCIMCDIWKDNKNLKQLKEEDIQNLLASIQKLNTRLVLMSGGEALLNQGFFELCALLKTLDVKISLLSTGLSLKQHAENIVKYLDDVIVSVDGTEVIHNKIRRIPHAFAKLKEGIETIKALDPKFRISSRTVIQYENFRAWPEMIRVLKSLGLNQLSFLPADVSSTAFNHSTPGVLEEGIKLLPDKNELPELNSIIEQVITEFAMDFQNKRIAESPQKLRDLGKYYSAMHGLNAFPEKPCNAPWVSAVIEADGTLRPCFFLESLGNIHASSFEHLLNSEQSREFRKQLNTAKHPVCERCVCSLYLSPLKHL
ncbi:MAG: radical SAM protein [Bacteroidia bacterium]|nr:radical SAM protein [Bacteroidia bacterium]